MLCGFSRASIQRVSALCIAIALFYVANFYGTTLTISTTSDKIRQETAWDRIHHELAKVPFLDHSFSR